MTIIFLTRRFHPDIGGVEKHVFEISKILKSKGHNVTVITESRGRVGKFSGINIIRIKKFPNNWFKKFHIWKWMISNLGIFRNADVIHAHDVYYWYFPLKILNPFKKSYVTFHGYETKFPPSKKAIIVRKISEKMAKGNICVGKFIEKWYRTRANFINYGLILKNC